MFLKPPTSCSSNPNPRNNCSKFYIISKNPYLLHILTHVLHVWNIYLHLPNKWPSHVGKYTIHGASGMENSKQTQQKTLELSAITSRALDHSEHRRSNLNIGYALISNGWLFFMLLFLFLETTSQAKSLVCISNCTVSISFFIGYPLVN